MPNLYGTTRPSLSFRKIPHLFGSSSLTHRDAPQRSLRSLALGEHTSLSCQAAMASDSGPASSDPLLPGRRAPSTGGWKSALFIICKPRCPHHDLAGARSSSTSIRFAYWRELRGACRGGGGGAVRLLRHLVQPDQLPDRPARADHGGGRRGGERVVGRRVHAAAPRRRRRRLLARTLPDHRRLLRALHHGEPPTTHRFSSISPRARHTLLIFRSVLACLGLPLCCQVIADLSTSTTPSMKFDTRGAWMECNCIATHSCYKMSPEKLLSVLRLLKNKFFVWRSDKNWWLLGWA